MARGRDPYIKVRIDAQLKRWLQQRALAASRSMNGEVEHLLKAVRDTEGAGGTGREAQTAGTASQA